MRGLAIAALTAALVCTSCAGQQTTPPTDRITSVAHEPCKANQLRLSNAPGAVPETGEWTFTIRIRNQGSFCVVRGFPQLTFRDVNGMTIPYVMRHSGASRELALPNGPSAWIAIRKYRCDLHSYAAPHTVELRLGGSPGRSTLQSHGNWAYCGAGDPGSTAYMWSFEPTLREAWRHE